MNARQLRLFHQIYAATGSHFKEFCSIHIQNFLR